MTGQQTAQSGWHEHVNQLADRLDVEQRERAAAARVPAVPTSQGRARRARRALAFTAPTLTAIVLFSFAGPVREFLFEEKLTPTMAQEDARRTLTALVAEIESFRHDYNELPETLVEIGVPSRGRWTYTTSGKNLYRVKGSVQGQHVAFDSVNGGGL